MCSFQRSVFSLFFTPKFRIMQRSWNFFTKFFAGMTEDGERVNIGPAWRQSPGFDGLSSACATPASIESRTISIAYSETDSQYIVSWSGLQDIHMFSIIVSLPSSRRRGPPGRAEIRVSATGTGSAGRGLRKQGRQGARRERVVRFGSGLRLPVDHGSPRARADSPLVLARRRDGGPCPGRGGFPPSGDSETALDAIRAAAHPVTWQARRKAGAGVGFPGDDANGTGFS